MNDSCEQTGFVRLYNPKIINLTTMNRTDMIDNIRAACHCGERRAGEYLDAELRSLGELRDAGELHYGDLETACSGLGLEYDSIDYFMAALALN